MNVRMSLSVVLSAVTLKEIKIYIFGVSVARSSQLFRLPSRHRDGFQIRERQRALDKGAEVSCAEARGCAGAWRSDFSVRRPGLQAVLDSLLPRHPAFSPTVRQGERQDMDRIRSQFHQRRQLASVATINYS